MAKYEVLTTLWSPSQNKYFNPGEEVELDDDIALLLLKKDAIKPAVLRRTKVYKYEVKDDTDSRQHLGRRSHSGDKLERLELD